MGIKIRTFQDGSFLEYDKGSFDSWCVYFTKASGERKPPRDMDYFAQLKELASRYGASRVYDDYVHIYDRTGKKISEAVFSEIHILAEYYGKDALQVEVLLSILYMTMIAEERKEYTRLGKRIKRLGVYQLLMEGKSIRESANFTRGMGWRDIAALCEARGF